MGSIQNNRAVASSFYFSDFSEAKEFRTDLIVKNPETLGCIFAISAAAPR